MVVDYPNDGGTKFGYVGYGPMYLEVRRAAEQAFCGNATYDTSTLTRLHLIGANGNDQEMIDTKSHGAPQSTSVYCVNGSFNAPSYYSRGREFVSTDSSDITYEQDTTAPEVDDCPAVALATGFLYLRDGTRYRVVGGLVQWMSDRNGNMITFDRTGDIYNRVVQITDPLGRVINIEYGNAQNTPHPNEDWIKYSGTGSSPRLIKVRYAALADRLRSSSWTTKAVKELFTSASYPDELSNVNSNIYNPQMVSEIEFPNGQKYQFLYDPYGELSRLTLPTGGVLEYDWASFTNNAGGIYGDLMIYRRLTERRKYTDPNTLEGKTIYGAPVLTNPGANLTVTASDRDAGGTPLRLTASIFWGTPLSSEAILAGSPLAYPYWKDGHLNQEMLFDANVTALLQQTTNTWQQRNPATNLSETPPDSAAPNDPRITLTQRTLGTLTAKTTYTYSIDAHNSIAEQCDYDYGAAQASRCVSRLFETSSVYTAAPAHLRSLLTQETIRGLTSTGTLTMEAQTTYQYDQAPVFDRPNISQHDPTRSAFYRQGGNPTSISRWLPSAPNSAATTQYQYDIAGNIVQIDAPEVQTSAGLVRPQTTASYDDNYDTNPGAPTYAFPTSVTHPEDWSPPPNSTSRWAR